MNKEHLTQLEKYGGVEGYSAEMRRRRALVKNHPGGNFSDPEIAREAQKLSTKAKLERKRIEETHANKDT